MSDNILSEGSTSDVITGVDLDTAAPELQIHYTLAQNRRLRVIPSRSVTHCSIILTLAEPLSTESKSVYMTFVHYNYYSVVLVYL